MPKKATPEKAAPAKPAQPSMVAPNSSVKVTVPWSQLKPAYDKALQKAAQRIKQPGFRKGKVPPAMAEKVLDSNALFKQALNEVLPPLYTEALQKANKHPLSQPQIEPEKMEKGKDWVFVIYFAERPEIKLGDYQKAIKKGEADAAKEIKETEAEHAKKHKGKTAPATADKDDHVHEDGHLHEHQQEDIRLKHIFKALIEASKPQIPELLIREEADRQLGRLSDQLKQLNIQASDYLKSRNIQLEDLRQEYAASALGSLQIEFVLAEIAKQENVTVTDSEIDDTLEKLFEGKLTAEQKKKQEYRTYVFSTVLKQKVLKYLLKKL